MKKILLIGLIGVSAFAGNVSISESFYKDYGRMEISYEKNPELSINHPDGYVSIHMRDTHGFNSNSSVLDKAEVNKVIEALKKASDRIGK